MSPVLSNGVDTYTLLSEPGVGHSGASFLNVTKDTSLAYVYVPITAIPAGATLLSATLRLYTVGSWALTPTVTCQRISSVWGASTTTWTASPTLTGVTTTVTHASAADADEFAFDVLTTVTAAIANGHWYGLGFARTDVGAAKAFYSVRSAHPPTLTLTWSVPPSPPTGVRPSGGRAVATPAPTISFDGSDVTAVQVQLDTTSGDFSSPTFDSTMLAATTPELDLSTTIFGGLTAGVDVQARVQYENSSGVASGYSSPVHLTYQPYADVTFTNPPPTGIVSTDTPVMTWTLGSGTQSAYQLSISPSGDPLTVVYDSSPVASTSSGQAVPQGAILDSSSFLATLHTIDSYDREAVPGFPIYTTTQQEFAFQNTGALPSPTSLFVEQIGTSPFNDLQFTIDDVPDSFQIRRDEAIIAGAEETSDLTPDIDGTYHWTDYTAQGATLHHYRVEAKVGEQVSGNGPVYDVLTTPVGIWLGDPVGGLVVSLLGTESGTWTMGEEASVYNPLRGTDAVRIVQAQRGYEGTITGFLRNDPTDTGPSARHGYAALMTIKAAPDQTYVIAFPTLAFFATLGNIVAAPADDTEERWDVSFDFWQQGPLTWLGRNSIGSETTLTGTWDYEEGVNNTNVTTITNVGAVAVAGTVKYATVAALHGAMGVRCGVFAGTSGGAGTITYPCATIGMASLYFTPRFSSGSGSVIRLDPISSGNVAFIVLKSSGALAIADASNSNVVSSNVSDLWTIGGSMRVDIQWTWLASVITIVVRVFLSMEATYPSDEFTASFASPDAPAFVLGGNGSGTKTTDIDSMRVWTGNSTWPAPWNPAGQAVLAPWSGDATQTTVEISGLTQGYSLVGLGVSTSSIMAGATLYTSVAPDVIGWNKFHVTGLTVNTPYFYQFRDGGGFIGPIFQTHTLKAIGTACTTKIAVGSCKVSNPSSNRAFLDIVAWAPDRMQDLGDFGYPNSLGRDQYSHEQSFAIEAQDSGRLLVQSLFCVDYITSDHDVNGHGPSNSPNYNDPISAANLLAWQSMVPARFADVRVPMRARYRSDQEGNVRYVKLDTRSQDRTDTRGTGVGPTDVLDGSGNPVTMLGLTQLAWLKAEIDAAHTAGQMIVLFTDPDWNGLSPTESDGISASYSDKWPSYTVERDAISDYAVSKTVKLFIVYGDSHIIQQDSGASYLHTFANPRGGGSFTFSNEKNGFATICCGPFDQNMHAHYQESSEYNYPAGITEGDHHPQARMYQRLTVAQVGTTVTITATVVDCTTGTAVFPTATVNGRSYGTMTKTYTLP